MAKISKADVEHTAKLARIELTDAERQKFTEQLSGILDYVGQLDKVDTKNIEPTAHIGGLENVLREDKVKNPSGKEIREKMLQNAPEQEDGYIKVKKVFE